MSVRTAGRPPEKRDSGRASISDDGRYVAFLSKAALVRGIGWAKSQDEYRVYVRDRVAKTTEAVDVRPDGQLGTIGFDGSSSDTPSISADGRYVAFESQAHDLVPADTNEAGDVFLRDRVTGETTLVSATRRGAPGNGASFDPVISADGSTVAFASRASNLVAGDTNGNWDVFRTDLATRTTRLVSQTPAGAFPDGFSHSPQVSGDGDVIVFLTDATDIVEGGYPDGDSAVLHDVVAGRSILASRGMDGEPPDEQIYSPAIDEEGTTVVFDTEATNIAPGGYPSGEDIFVFDVGSEQTTLVSRAWDGGPSNGQSIDPVISGDRIAFESGGRNLVRDDGNDEWDVFVHDRGTGLTTLVSRNRQGAAANLGGEEPALAGDGAHLAFISEATDLVKGTGRAVDRVYATRLPAS